VADSRLSEKFVHGRALSGENRKELYRTRHHVKPVAGMGVCGVKQKVGVRGPSIRQKPAPNQRMLEKWQGVATSVGCSAQVGRPARKHEAAAAGAHAEAVHLRGSSPWVTQDYSARVRARSTADGKVCRNRRSSRTTTFPREAGGGYVRLQGIARCGTQRFRLKVDRRARRWRSRSHTEQAGAQDQRLGISGSRR